MTWDEFKAYIDKELERQGAHGGFDLSTIEFESSRGVDIEVDTTAEFFAIYISN